MKTRKSEKFNKVIRDFAKMKGITTGEARSLMREALDNTTVKEMAHALTYFCFRNGPVENMHEAGKLSEKDMKKLNQYCYNKLFTFLTLQKANELEMMLPIFFWHGITDWDEPEFQIYDPES